MARYIDADAFFADFSEIRDYEYASQDYEVDAVPVIRCKDCKHRGTDDCPMYFEEQVEWEEDGGYIECDTIYHDYTEDDGFCDRGERKE